MTVPSDSASESPMRAPARGLWLRVLRGDRRELPRLRGLTDCAPTPRVASDPTSLWAPVEPTTLPSPPPDALGATCERLRRVSMTMRKTVWERLERKFMSVSPVCLLRSPSCSSCMTMLGVRATSSHRSCTTGPATGFSTIFMWRSPVNRSMISSL